MKIFTGFLCCFFFSLSAFAQTEIKEKIYSGALKENVYYNVIVPEHWSASQQLPALYLFNYGMMDAQYIAAQLHYFKNAHYSMPNTIVVNIMADMDRIGFVYKTAMLTPKGLNFINCIKNEIIPAVQKKYNTAAFRMYIGHSYAASYGNYLLQYKPEMFNGYILLAPERTGIDYSKVGQGDATPSPFILDENAKRLYNQRTSFYYAAVGEFDMERRRIQAKEVVEKLGQLDSTKFYAKYDSIAKGNHTNILTYAIQPALEFIYQLYAPDVADTSHQTAFEQLMSEESRVTKIYGIGLNGDYTGYNSFIQLAIKNKDTASLLKIIEHFCTKQPKAYDIRNWGQSCISAGLIQEAKKYFELAIKAVLTDTIKNDWGPFVLSDCYYAMAVNVYKSNPVTRWNYLQKSIALIDAEHRSGSKNIDTYFEVGSFLIDNSFHLREGLQYMLKYEQVRHDAIDDIHWPYEKIFLYIGKGYALLNDTVNAKLYLHKALDINASNTEAMGLLAKFKQ